MLNVSQTFFSLSKIYMPIEYLYLWKKSFIEIHWNKKTVVHRNANSLIHLLSQIWKCEAFMSPLQTLVYYDAQWHWARAATYNLNSLH